MPHVLKADISVVRLHICAHLLTFLVKSHFPYFIELVWDASQMNNGEHKYFYFYFCFCFNLLAGAQRSSEYVIGLIGFIDLSSQM